MSDTKLSVETEKLSHSCRSRRPVAFGRGELGEGAERARRVGSGPPRRDEVWPGGVFPGAHADGTHADVLGSGDVTFGVIPDEERMLRFGAEEPQRLEERRRMRLAEAPAQLVAKDDDVEGVVEAEGVKLGPLTSRARR